MMEPADSKKLSKRALPMGAVVGFAIGGAIVLFAVSVVLGLWHVQRKHRREKRRMSEVEGGGHVDMCIESSLVRHGEKRTKLPKRVSFNPFLPLDHDELHYHDWAGEDGLRNPPKAKLKRLSTQKSLFRMSGMRESWPLVSNISLSMMSGGGASSNIMLRNCAAPGYEVPADPKWPKRKRSISRSNSRSKVSVPRDMPRMGSPSNDPFVSTRSPGRPRAHSRSTSETHLTSILRSTSQRLKTDNKHPLTRTLTTLDRDPGSPPLHRLPSPTKRRGPSESREALIDSDHDESVASSVYDLLRSPTPKARQSPRKSVQFTPTRNNRRSRASSAASDDSLCATPTPDPINPVPLTSPSKNGSRSSQRRSVRVLSAGSLGDTDKGQPSNLKDVRASTIGAPGPLDMDMRRALSLSGPHRISLASDPFYSRVKSAKPVIPPSNLEGPRPLYIRKATFGQESSSQRPQSSASPLSHISGNVQALPKPHSTLGPLLSNQSRNSQQRSRPGSRNENRSSQDGNPFQWSPQEGGEIRTSQISPNRRRGHKRSKVVRISQLPRLSSVTIVPEECEEDGLPMQFQNHNSNQNSTNNSTQNLVVEPVKAPSPLRISTISGKRLSGRPPSSAVFNPSLSTFDLSGRAGDNSPTLGMEEMMNLYSPTLSTNYYTENSGASEDEFFAKLSSSRSSVTSIPHHSRNLSNELFLFPGTSTGTPPPGKLVSFPPPDITSQQPLINPSPVSRPLPSTSSMTAPPYMKSTTPLPVPPILTMPVPGHLTGPRVEPPRGSGTISSPREPLEVSIGMLRRMNSEMTCYSNSSAPASPERAEAGESSMTNLLPTVSSTANIFKNFEDEESERGRSRGSRHYLAIGSNPLPTSTSSSQIRSQPRGRRPIEKRDSHRVYKERRKRRYEDLEKDSVGGLIYELTPVKEVSSPATEQKSKQANLVRPALGKSSLQSRVSELGGGEEFTVAIDEIDRHSNESPTNHRWSDAMPKPSATATRRESKMEHPSPKTPPKWGWGGLQSVNLAASRLMGYGEKVKSTEAPKDGFESPGLYDQAGFLKSSPDREAAMRREKEKTEAGSGSDGAAVPV